MGDTAKGILIILVVLGHCHVNIVSDMVINSFHMVAFFHCLELRSMRIKHPMNSYAEN